MKDNALYLEVDEDITSAIDKLSKAPAGSVQIVVPKRSTMLQSIINLKLLKKAADSTGKELVLVTGDRIAGDLAARVGLAVAPSVGAKAVMTESKIPEALVSNEEIIEENDPEPPPMPSEPKAKPTKKPLLKRLPVSDGLPVAPAALAAEPVAEAAADSGAALAPTPDKKAGPKVPNFHALQRRVLWVVIAVVLIGGYMGAMYLFTSAKVTLYASGTKISIDTTFSVDPALKTTDTAKSVLAGQTVTVSKDLSGSFVPTGKQDAGTKASGKMTVSNSTGVDQVLVGGTRFAAPDGKIFRSASDITVPKAYLNSSGDKVNGTMSVDVTADQNGDSYNEAPAAYTISALANPKITAQGAQMSGGTTKTITIVAQSDVDTQKAALLAKDKDNATRDLQGRVPSGYVALIASQSTTTSSVAPSPAVGSPGDTATLSIHVTYSELAVKKADYSDLILAQEQKQVGSGNQIYDDGLSNAQVTASDKDSSGRQPFHFTTEAFGGAKLDKTQLANKLKGMRYGDAANAAGGLAGVSRAEISIRPGWVSKMPSRADKISITIQVAGSK